MIAKDTATAARTRKLSFVYAVAVFSWMFDFKSSEAGAGLAVQSIFIVAYLASFALFVLVDRGIRKVSGFSHFFFSALIFIFTGFISGLFAGQELYAMFRNAFTVGLYVSIAYTTARMVLSCPLRPLRNLLAWLCLGFAASTFLIVLLVGGGVDLQTIRYQIQGSSGVAALGLVSLAFVLSLRGVELTTVLVSGLIIFFTVTRTYVVILVAQLLALFPFGKRLARKRPLMVVASLCVIGVLVMLAFPDVLERWMQRLFVREKFGGVDPTLLTRQVEWDYMWNAILSSPHSFFTGSGMAAKTSYSLDPSLGGSRDTFSSIGFGHSNHISLLFIGGLLGGAPLLLVQISQLLMALKFNGRALRRLAVESDAIFLGAWGGMIVIGTFVMGFFAPVFSDRGFSLWYGIGTGLLLGARTLRRRERVGGRSS